MSEPFLAEIRIIGFNFAPRGYASCDGQILPINQNQSLYSLLGTTYGGDGRTSFGLPDMRGRTPVHPGNGSGLDPVQLGQKGGAETHTLSISEIPAHSHDLNATGDQGESADPDDKVLTSTARRNSPVYTTPPATPTSLATGHITPQGGGQAHNNMQPFLVIHFVIALRGLFPSRS